MPRKRKIVGTFCERQVAPKGQFDKRSFRYVHSKKHWVLIGCPKGKWMPRKKQCRVGTRAHKILVATPRGKRCGRGARRIRKAI